MWISAQILIGCSPLLIMALILILRKKMIVIPALLAVMIVGISGYSLFRWDVGQSNGTTAPTAGTIEQLLSLTKEQLANGNTQGAEELLSQMYLQYGDDARITLQKARLAILQGKVTQGAALYEKAQALDGDITVSDKEADYFKQAQDGSILSTIDAAAQAAQVTYLTNQGEDPADYGYTKSADELTGMSDTLEDFQDAVQEAAADEEEGDSAYKEDQRTQIQDVWEAVSQVEAEKEKQEAGTNYNVDTVKQAVDTLEEAREEVPEIFGVKSVDEATVTALLMVDEPKQLVEYAEATDSQTAWVAVADQWMRGNLEEEDFSEDFITLSTKEYEELVERCEKLEEKLTDLTAQEQADVEEMVEAISARTQSLVLAELESRVTPETEALEEQSKLYLMDSAMQYELGSEESGNNSLQEAIQTSPYSDDSTYKTPLEKVAAVIHDTADSDEIKNTSDYLETAYENAVPYYSEEQSGQTSEEKETTSIPEAYKNQAANYVSTAKAMINIGAIDASAFPKVTFRLQTAKAIDTDNPTLKITDCNLEITDYTIQEVPFDGARVALVCDTSGSMDGSVQSLQDAVSKYVASMEDKEQTSIIAFADGVKFNSGFQSSAAGLESYISQLNADGGTNIGSGVWQAVNELEKEQNVYKAIIVLTDGEDSSFSEESLNELQQKCENADITLYTIGLGADIQAEYLQQIASYGNGQFIYCNEVDQLEALYAFIHKQMQHNYEVTYEAQNQDWSERVLAVENETDGAYAQKHYTIAGTDSTSTDGAVITAIDTKKIYKKEAQVEFNLIGTGFTTDTAVSVSIQGNMARQTLETEYVDETHIRVIIPADVPVDTYEIEATADQSVYKDTIEIFDKLQTLVYGAYTFTAQTIEKTDSKTTLSGDVTINDFIHFRGTVTLDGNVDSDVQIRLQESNGSYIRCTDALPGLLGSMCGNVIYLPSMGSITLYNDTVHLYDLDNYTVEQFNLPSLNFAAIGIGASSVALYPHKISLNIASVSLNFPLQEEILEYANTLPFTLEANLEALIVPEGLRIKGKVDGTKSESLKFTVFSFYLSELGLEFDTWKHDYSFVMKVGTKDIIPMSESNDSADYGFDIGITSGNWDSFHIYADFTIEPPTLPGVTFSDFSIGLEGLSQEGQNSSFLNRLWHSSLVGSCEVGFCKLSDYIPQLDSIFGDLAVLTLSDTKASISLGEMGLSLETTAKLLGAVEVGNAQISVGKYEYSNYLLGIDAQESYGLYTSLSVGPKLDLAKFKLETQGTTELNLSNRYLGVWVKGTSDIDIDFFGHHSSQVDGNALMAFHNDFKQFTIMAKGTNLKKNKTDGFKITVATNLWESEITLY